MDVFAQTKPGPETGYPASDIDDDEALDSPDDAPDEVKMLRICQRRALSAIMRGKGFGNAASAAGVSRRTVYNWVNKDEAFKAALSAWHGRMEEHAQTELTAAVASAARVFGRAAATDWRAAAVLLRQRGLLESKPGIPADHPLAKLEAMPPARSAPEEMEKRTAALRSSRGRERRHRNTRPELRGPFTEPHGG